MARCTLCNDLCKRHESHLELSFDFTLEEIARSALHGRCEPCLVIHEGLRQAHRDEWPLVAPLVKRVFARAHGEHGGRADTLHLVIVFENLWNEAPSLRLEFYSLKPKAWKAILPRSTISSNPLSTRAITWARERLFTCSQTHVACRTGRPKQLPKRLLLLERNSNGDIHMKLVEVKSDFCDAYAALSHCWGEERGLLTTARSLKSHKKYIPWLVIPDTFQDAIKLTLRLNIRYIWIDSLCILQDDLSDWEVESSKMAGIYQHAVLTLAATTSSASSQGSYSRSRRIEKHTEIVLPEGRAAYRIGVRERVRHWNKTKANDESQFPLLSRGWVLQERLLSTRVLHFCDTELIWECREVSACECGALNQDTGPGAVFYNLTKSFDEQKAELGPSNTIERFPSLWDRMKARSPSSRFRNSWLGPTPSPHLNTPSTTAPVRPSTVDMGRSQQPQTAVARVEVIPDFVSHYHRLVEQYSALKLTRPTDRLPAFSGLAERMQHFRDFYLAGIWSDSLCFDLMWRIDMHDLWETKSTRPKEYCGPSWSWITAIAPVKYWSDTVNYTDTVQRFLRELANGGRGTHGSDSAITTTPLLLNKAKIKHNVNVPGKNPFGSVDAGVLTVEASAVPAILRYTHHYTSARIDLPNYAGQRDIPDQYRIRYGVEVEYGDANDANVFVDISADYILNLPGPAEIPEGDELMLLLIHPDVALVLRQKVKADKHVYIKGEPVWERIGIARVWDELPGYGTVDWMMHSQVKTFRIV